MEGRPNRSSRGWDLSYQCHVGWKITFSNALFVFTVKRNRVSHNLGSNENEGKTTDRDLDQAQGGPQINLAMTTDEVSLGREDNNPHFNSKPNVF